MRLRSLCKLVDGRDWQWEKLFFALVGRALLSKTSLQLSADGLGCSPSAETEPCAAAAADPQHPLREFRGVTHCVFSF